MLTQDEWCALLDPESDTHWKERYRRVGVQMHAVLASVPFDKAISTADLVRRLLPDAGGEEGGHAVSRLFKILGKPVTSFPAAQGWFTEVYGRNSFNGQRNIRKRMWHAPEAKVTGAPPLTDPERQRIGEAEYASWFPVTPTSLDDLL